MTTSSGPHRPLPEYSASFLYPVQARSLDRDVKVTDHPELGRQVIRIANWRPDPESKILHFTLDSIRSRQQVFHRIDQAEHASKLSVAKVGATLQDDRILPVPDHSNRDLRDI